MVVLSKPLEVLPGDGFPVLAPYARHGPGTSDLYAITMSRDLGISSAKYQCVICRDPHYKDELSIITDDVRMDGLLNLTCRDCRNKTKADNDQMNQLDWQLLCSMKWLTRAYESDSKWEMRVRWVPWVEAQTDLDVLGCMVYRERLIRKSTTLALSIMAGIKKLGRIQQVDAVKVMDRWVDEWFNKVKDPQYVPAMLCAATISAHLMEFVDHVLPGPDEYFICRQKHCSLVCHSTFWVHNHPDGQYRCPACGEQYQPWKDLPGYVKANKVYVFVDEVGQQAGRAELAAGSSDGFARQNQVMIFPLRWPDIDSRTMIQRCRKIFLDIDQRLLVRHPKDRLGFALEHLSLTAPHKALEENRFRPNTKKIIDYLNTRRGPHQQVAWQYDHIDLAGYKGIKLGPEHDLDDPMELECFLRTFGLSLWLTERAAASRRSP